MKTGARTFHLCGWISARPQNALAFPGDAHWRFALLSLKSSFVVVILRVAKANICHCTIKVLGWLSQIYGQRPISVKPFRLHIHHYIAIVSPNSVPFSFGVTNCHSVVINFNCHPSVPQKQELCWLICCKMPTERQLLTT